MADTVATTDRSSTLPTVTPLLRTKLFIPQARHLQRILPRPRLVERLQAGLARQLTLISAPAGYGKTVLLTEWIPQSPRCVCWLSLDETDNDIARFLTYSIAAIQMLKADFGQTLLAALQSPQPPVVESVISALVNEVVQALDDFALVLDDYHLIQQPAIHAAIAFLLQHLPPNMHLIITSRADPPLPLARLRVRGQMTELRAADLRFTPDEATAFFHQSKKLPLSADQIEELETRTEGWGAGLQLAALSLQGVDAAGIARFIHDFTGSHHNVYDYLAEDVLKQQPEEIRHFLLHTSLLNRLCAPLCNAILRDGAEAQDAAHAPVAEQQVLEYLEHANLFLVPLDNQRHWYRYHHLFADFLRQQLQREIGPTAVTDLYRRARLWHEQHNLAEEAINYALAGRDWPGAVRITERVTTSLWSSSRYLLHWLESLPAEEVEQSPDLCIWYSTWLMMSGEFAQVEKYLETAERVLRLNRNFSTLAGVYGNRATASFLRDDAHSTFENARQAMSYFDDQNRFIHARVTELLARGYFLKGEIAEAEQVWAEALKMAQADDSQRTLLLIRGAQAEVQRMRGKLRQAAQLDVDLLQQIGDRPADLAKVRALSRLANLAYEWNQLAQAEQYAQQAVELAEQTHREIFTRSACLTLARLYQTLGAEEKAVQMLEQAKAFAQRMGGKRPLLEVNASQVCLWLTLPPGAGQNLAAAIQWAATQPLDLESALPYEEQPTHLAFCRLWLAQQQPERAIHLLTRLLTAAEAAGRVGERVEMLVLNALAYQAHAQPNEAIAALVQALLLAEPEGYIRTFVDEGWSMAQLLIALSQQPSAVNPAYLHTLLAAFPAFEPSYRPQVELFSAEAVIPVFEVPPTSPPPILLAPRDTVTTVTTVRPMGQVSSETLVEPLSKREVEILALIAQGWTNPEIAQRIYISDQTVKVHTRNIYGKLGVNGRREAVAKARDLGLLA